MDANQIMICVLNMLQNLTAELGPFHPSLSPWIVRLVCDNTAKKFASSTRTWLFSFAGRWLDLHQLRVSLKIGQALLTAKETFRVAIQTNGNTFHHITCTAFSFSAYVIKCLFACMVLAIMLFNKGVRIWSHLGCA